MAILSQGLSGGGAERWAIDLADALTTGGRLQVVGLASLSPERAALSDEAESRHCVGHGEAASKTLASTADIVVTWGWANTIDWLSGVRAKLVVTAQGPGEWTQAVTHGWRAADGLVAVSEHAATGFEEAARARVTVIPNGVGVGRCKAKRSPAEVWQELGLAPDARVAIVVARVSPEKRPWVVFDALKHLPENWVVLHLGACWFGAGSDDYRAAQAAAGPRAISVGFTDSVGDYLQIADCFVLPSQFEGHSLAMVEAMIAGVPVIATPVGSFWGGANSELARVVGPMAEGEELARAILADERDKVGTLARASLARSHALAHWTWDGLARRWEDYLLGLLGSPTDPTPPTPTIAESMARYREARACPHREPCGCVKAKCRRYGREVYLTDCVECIGRGGDRV